MSKKIVPDPPLQSPALQLLDTLAFTTGAGAPGCPSTLFSVHAGVPARDALKHVSILLTSAALHADEINLPENPFETDLFLSMRQSMEVARVVIASLLVVSPEGCQR